MIGLLLGAVGVFVGYVIAACAIDGGVPYSLSATYYRLTEKVWFGVSMCASAALLLPIAVSVGIANWAGFLACGALMFVGLAPNFRMGGLEHTVHMSGAISCIVFSQVYVAFNSPLWLLTWAPLAAYIVIQLLRKRATFNFVKDCKPMFWAEICAVSGFVGVLFGLV